MYDEILFHGATFRDLDSATGRGSWRPRPTSPPGRASRSRKPTSIFCAPTSTRCRCRAPRPLRRRCRSCCRPSRSTTTAARAAGAFRAGRRRCRIAMRRRGPRDGHCSASRRWQAFQDSKNRPYLHLVDGGLADNLGMRGVLETLEQIEAARSLNRRTRYDQVRRIVVFVVNSLSVPRTDWDKSARPPNDLVILLKATGVPIDRYSYEAVELLKEITFSLEDGAAGARDGRGAGGRPRGPARSPADPRHRDLRDRRVVRRAPRPRRSARTSTTCRRRSRSRPKPSTACARPRRASFRSRPSSHRLVQNMGAKVTRTPAASDARSRLRGLDAVIDALFALQRAAFARERYPSLAVRRDRLARLQDARLAARGALRRGGGPRFRRPLGARDAARGAVHRRRGDRGRAAPSRALDAAASACATPLHLKPARARIERQPVGVVGVISPWNYPRAARAVARRRRAGRRQPRDAEAVGAHAGDVRAAARARRGELCRRRVRRRHRRCGPRARVRAAAVRSPVLHRIDGGRPRGRARRGGEPDAGHARARRQVARAVRAGRRLRTSPRRASWPASC